MKLTANEIKALQAIVNSEYQSSNDPVGHDVWTLYVNPFSNKRTQSGVYASLSKKGLIRIGGGNGAEFSDDMGTVHITQVGHTAFLNAAKKFSQKGKPL